VEYLTVEDCPGVSNVKPGNVVPSLTISNSISNPYVFVTIKVTLPQ
jgi:hypothetical protein